MLAALNVILNMLLFQSPRNAAEKLPGELLCAEQVSGLPGSQGFNLIWQAE